MPTPLDTHQQPDISYVKSSTEAISKYLTKGTMVVLESTTYPGTTEELIKPILEEGSGLKCGEDFYLGFSPERVDPGNLIYKTKEHTKSSRSNWKRCYRSNCNNVQSGTGRRCLRSIFTSNLLKWRKIFRKYIQKHQYRFGK